MPTLTVSINRAPVLPLWAAVVAQRLGFTEDEALTLGKAVAGLNAQAKGRRLDIFKPYEEKAKKAWEQEPGERFWIEVLGWWLHPERASHRLRPSLAPGTIPAVPYNSPQPQRHHFSLDERFSNGENKGRERRTERRERNHQRLLSANLPREPQAVKEGQQR